MMDSKMTTKEYSTIDVIGGELQIMSCSTY